MKSLISIFFILFIVNILIAQDCDTLDNQWLTPFPTVITYGFGVGWITDVLDPSNSINTTDPKGIYESYPTPNPGIEAVSAVRVGNFADADGDTRFDIVVYDDNGGGARSYRK
jgi:hypothetical protein